MNENTLNSSEIARTQSIADRLKKKGINITEPRNGAWKVANKPRIRSTSETTIAATRWIFENQDKLKEGLPATQILDMIRADGIMTTVIVVRRICRQLGIVTGKPKRNKYSMKDDKRSPYRAMEYRFRVISRILRKVIREIGADEIFDKDVDALSKIIGDYVGLSRRTNVDQDQINE